MKNKILCLPVLQVIGIVLFASMQWQCTEDADYEPSEDYKNCCDNVVVVNGERYNQITENPFVNTSDTAISTFSIDVDGGSYSNIRRYIEQNNALPPKEAVRTEEVVNYFSYQLGEPSADVPIYVEGEVAGCPWADGHKLIRIGMKGKHIERTQLPAANWVFLIDVSGSMASEDKLPLLKKSLLLFVDQMTDNDRVAIVTYAGNADIPLASTSGNNKTQIKNVINNLSSNGSTNGAQGIITAYDIAKQNFIEGGNNRVLLATDGDFNVGVSSDKELTNLIIEKRKTGIFLTVIGLGQGNLNDAMMEQLANKGNGNYEYIDNLEQGKKIFVSEYSAFFNVAQDVKIQIEFSPTIVSQYRLIGYENRKLNNDDFENDTTDAGEIGVDKSIMALYEIIPVQNADVKASSTFTIKVRYKLPNTDNSLPHNVGVFDAGKSFAEASENMRFAASAAAFGMMVGQSQYKGSVTYDKIISWASAASSYNPEAQRTNFITLVTAAKKLSTTPSSK